MVIKKLAGCIRDYKKASILTPILVTLEVAIECVIPMIMALLIDNIYGNSLNVIVKFGIILLGMALLSLFLGFLSGKFSATAACGFAKNLRHDLYYKVQDFSFSNIDKFSSSGLVTRLTTDVTNVQNAFMMILRMAVRFPMMLIFSMVMSLTINVTMFWIFAGIVPVIALCLFFIIWKAYPIFDRVFKEYDNLNNSIQENIRGMRVVKTYVREDFEKQKFGNAAEGLRKDFTKAEKILALATPLMQFAIYLAILLISFIGSMIIINTFGGYDAAGNPVWGDLSTGQLASLMAYSGQILFSLMMITMVMVMITMASASAKRITEVLVEKSNIVNPENPIMDLNSGEISFENVSFKYFLEAENMALSNIDLHIKEGETVGILGGTGSSKTSLVQLVPRLYDTSEGTVKVGGRDVKEYDIESLRNGVAVVLQKNILFSGTIKENLRWGNKNATDEEIIHACKASCADDFIEGFPDKYDTFIEQGGSNVSGGQKQRLCIARALLKKPKILILDDSTSAVDTKTDSMIRKAFREEIPNTTKLIIAQRVASVMDADKIVVMDNGRIDSVGTHEELLKTSSIYQEVYYSQNKVGGAGNENA